MSWMTTIAQYPSHIERQKAVDNYIALISINQKSMSRYLVIAITFTCWRAALSFSLLPSSVSALRCQRLPLCAVKPNSNKKKTKPASLGGTGTGFGTAPKASADVKVRAVSGFSGSGTKPLRQAANTFDELLKEQQQDGNSCVSDVYVRSPLNDKSLFWFVGKVARCTIVDNLKGTSLPTEQEAIISQKRLILEYAKRELRPQNMGGPFEKGLELWLAPGNSEMDVVQNKVSLVKVEGSLSSLADGFHVGDVGYNPEIYVGDVVQKGGLRVVRDEQGHPIKPVFEVNEAQ